MQASMALQHLARLPSLALQQMRVIGQGLKDKITDIWQKAVGFFGETNDWRVFFKPLYDRYIKPLDKGDVLIFSGSLAVAILITILAAQIFGFAALPLGGVIGMTIMGIAYSLIRRRMEHYLEKEARKEVDKIRLAVNDITHNNRSFEGAQKAREELRLRQDEFDHLSKDWDAMDKELNLFKGIVLSDSLGKTEKNLNEAKKTVLTYLAGLLRRLDPYQPVNPLPDPLINMSDRPNF